MSAQPSRTQPQIEGTASLKLQDVLSPGILMRHFLLGALCLLLVLMGSGDPPVFGRAFHEAFMVAGMLLALVLAAVPVLAVLIARLTGHGSHSFVVDETRIISAAGHRTVLPWELVEPFRKRSTGFGVRIQWGREFWIPKRAFDEAGRDALVRIAAHHGLLKP